MKANYRIKELSDTIEWNEQKLSEAEWDKLLFTKRQLSRTKFAEAVGLPRQSYSSFFQYTRHDKTKRKKLGKVGRPRKQPESEAITGNDCKQSTAPSPVISITLKKGSYDEDKMMKSEQILCNLLR